MPPSTRRVPMGKGLAVVADENRSLAERSKQSNNSITAMVSKMFAMLKDVKSSNEQNLSSVDAGITQISKAKQEAVNLVRLQEDSRTRIEQIAKDCDRTMQCSHDVRKMSDQMEELVKNSQVCADSIVEKADNQSRITGVTEETFAQVAQIAGMRQSARSPSHGQWLCPSLTLYGRREQHEIRFVMTSFIVHKIFIKKVGKTIDR